MRLLSAQHYCKHIIVHLQGSSLEPLFHDAGNLAIDELLIPCKYCIAWHEPVWTSEIQAVLH